MEPNANQDPPHERGDQGTHNISEASSEKNSSESGVNSSSNTSGSDSDEKQDRSSSADGSSSSGGGKKRKQHEGSSDQSSERGSEETQNSVSSDAAVKEIEAQRAYNRRHKAMSRKRRKDKLGSLEQNIKEATENQKKLMKTNQDLKDEINAVLSAFVEDSSKGLVSDESVDQKREKAPAQVLLQREQQQAPAASMAIAAAPSQSAAIDPIEQQLRSISSQLDVTSMNPSQLQAIFSTESGTVSQQLQLMGLLELLRRQQSGNQS